MKPKKAKNRLVILFDLIVFTVVVALLFKYSDANPGDWVFLFVFENVIMMFSFAIFFLIFSPVTTLLRQKHFGVKLGEKNHLSVKGFFNLLGVSVLFLALYLAGYALVIVILDQIMVELVVGFFSDNDYTFESLKILGEGGVFFEAPVVDQMQELIGINLNWLFVILGARYFIEMTIDLFRERKFLEEEESELMGVFKIIGHAVLGPISLFIAFVPMVILTAIYGPQPWIVILTLILFRLLFNLLYSLFNRK